MKLLIILMVAVVSNLLALDFVSPVTNQPTPTQVSEEFQIYSDVNTEQYEAALKTKHEGKINEKIQYFINSEFSSAEQLECPDLTFFGNDYFTRVSYINPLAGEIQCDVISNENKDVVVYTQKFTNPLKVKDYKDQVLGPQNTENQSLIDEDAIDFRKLYEEKITLIQAEKSNGTFEEEDIDNSKELNFVELLMAVISLNNEIINIKESLESRQFIFENGYFLQNKDEIVNTRSESLEFMREVAKEIFTDNGLDYLNVFAKPGDTSDDYIINSSKAQKMANDELLFYLESVSTLDRYIQEILTYMVAISLAWLGSHHIYNYIKSAKTNDDHKRPNGWQMSFSLIPIVAIAALFYNASDIATIQGLKEEFKVTKTRLQTQLAELNQQTTSFADSMSLTVIDLYISNLSSRSGVDSIKQVQSKELYARKLKKENLELTALDGICANQINLFTLESKYDELSVSEKYTQNPYPKTDKILNSYFEKSKLSPYDFDNNMVANNNFKTLSDPSYKEEKQGVIKNTIFKVAACSSIKEQIITNKREIEAIDNKIAIFNNVEKYSKNQEKIQKLYQLMYSYHDEYSYYSLAFLPLLSVSQKIIEISADKELEYKEMLFYSDNQMEDLARMALEKAPYLMLFDLSTVMSFIKSIASFLTGWIPFFGDTITQGITVIATIILVDLSVALIPALKLFFFMVLIVVMFSMNLLQKLAVYIISPFIVIYLLSTKQFEKVSQFGVTVIYVSMKDIIYIFVIVFTLISLSITEGLYMFFLNDFGNIIETSGGTFSVVIASFGKAILTLLFQILQFWMVWYLLVNLSGKFMEMLQLNAQDMAKELSEKMSHSLAEKMK